MNNPHLESPDRVLRWLVRFVLAALGVVLVLVAVLLAWYLVDGLGADLARLWMRLVRWWGEDGRWIFLAAGTVVALAIVVGWRVEASASSD